MLSLYEDRVNETFPEGFVNEILHNNKRKDAIKHRPCLYEKLIN